MTSSQAVYNRLSGVMTPIVSVKGGGEMPVFDTPITTDDVSLQKVLKQTLPIIVYLYNQPDPALDRALNTVAHDYAGKLLIARVNAIQSPQTYAEYQRPPLPALLAFRNGDSVSRSAPANPEDVKAQVAYVLGQGPKPTEPTPASQSQDAAHPSPVTDQNFVSEVLQSNVPVLVDFWAPWCGPCHMIAPTLDRLAKKYAGRVKIVKLNIDENPRTASQYQTYSIPTLILFKGGQSLERVMGVQPQPALERLIESSL